MDEFLTSRPLGKLWAPPSPELGEVGPKVIHALQSRTLASCLSWLLALLQMLVNSEGWSWAGAAHSIREERERASDNLHS